MQTFIDINNEVTDKGVVKGAFSWVEGCRINSSLTLGARDEDLVVWISEILTEAHWHFRNGYNGGTESLIRKDTAKFGHLVDISWQLNKQLDPNSSNDEIEPLFERVRPFIFGAKLLGAGGGGFMLMICKSAQEARSVQEMLETEPPNERARFFDFDISNEGLTVTVS